MRDDYGLESGKPLPDRGDPKDVQFSKYLCKVLRHDAFKMGLEMRQDGFARLEEILKHKKFKRFKFTVERVKKVIEVDAKRRYSMRIDADNVVWIRCNQGHSIEFIDNNLLLLPLTDQYPVVVHGTFRRHLPVILREGLSRMNRNHIHFVAESPSLQSESGRIQAGIRLNCEVLIFVDALNSARDNGISFFISDNNVVLSPGPIPAKFFIKVLEIQPDGSLRQVDTTLAQSEEI